VAASEAPGVLPIATFSLEGDVPGHPMLARDAVRYQGQLIAAVVAEDRYAAHDGAAVINVACDRLAAVTDPVEATRGDAPTLFEGVPDNVVVDAELGEEAETEVAFEEANCVVECDLVNNRLIPNALEPRAAVARYDAGDEHLTVEMTSQPPHGHRGKLSETLGVDAIDMPLTEERMWEAVEAARE